MNGMWTALAGQLRGEGRLANLDCMVIKCNTGSASNPVWENVCETPGYEFGNMFFPVPDLNIDKTLAPSG